MTERRSRAALGAVVVAALLAPAVAQAAGAKRVGIPKFEGAQEALIRKQVMQVLKSHGYELVKSREMEATVSNTGALLESDDGFQKVAKELALSAIVTGEVGKKRAKIIVHDGREGSVLGEGSFGGANPKKIAAEVGKTFWKQLGADIERGHAPSGSKKPKPPVAETPEDDENAPEASGGDTAAAEPEPKSMSKKARDREKEEKEPKADIVAAGPSENADGDSESEAPKKKKKKKKSKGDADTGEDGDAGGNMPPTLDASAGFVGINRGYAYNQDRSMLRPYTLPLGPAVGINVVAYPMGLAGDDGPLANLGVEAHFEYAFGIQSGIGGGDPQLPNAKFATTVHEFAGGVRYRFPFAASHQFWLSLTGGEHAFVFKSTAGCATTMSGGTTSNTCRPRLDIPDTIYRFAQPGVGARFEFGDISVSLAAGYRLILNGAGDHFQQFFPHRTVGGLEADGYVAYRFMDSFEARLSFQWRRYFYSMNSTQADVTAMMMDPNALPKVAGGAVDQYISGGVGIAWLFGGSERVAPAEEEAPPAKKKKKKKGEEEESEEE